MASSRLASDWLYAQTWDAENYDLVFADCGHFSFLEQPDRVQSSIADFLAAT